MPVRASLRTSGSFGEIRDAECREFFAAVLDHRLYLQQVAGDREKPLGGVDLDLVLPAVRNLQALDDDVYACAADRELRVAIEVADDLYSPRRDLTGSWLHAPVQVDAYKRVAAREHEAKSAELLATSQGFIGLLE